MSSVTGQWPLIYNLWNGIFQLQIRTSLFRMLTLFHSERPKLYTILAFLSAIGLRNKVNGYTVRGSNSYHFHFWYLVCEGQLLHEQIRSCKRKSFLQQLTPFWESFIVSWKQIGSHKSCLTFVSSEVYPFTLICGCRALDEREYLMILFHIETIGLVKTVQMRGHNIRFYAKLTKIIPNYHQILVLI